MPTDYKSESTWQDNYELGRPGWPREVLNVPSLPSTATIAEVGAGTGKLTQLLASEFEHVVGIEPDQEMRRFFAARCPRTPVLAGNSDAIPLAHACVDAVFIAEAFHLFASQATVREISRVLKPRGTLVLLWNLPAGPTEPSIAAALELISARGPSRDQAGYEPSDLNPRRYASGEWRLAFAESDFGAFEEARLPNPQLIDRNGLVAFFGSMGWIADLAKPERLPLLGELRSVLPVAQYRRPWETRIHWAQLR
jgi:SAM-dependent methyltransferase